MSISELALRLPGIQVRTIKPKPRCEHRKYLSPKTQDIDLLDYSMFGTDDILSKRVFELNDCEEDTFEMFNPVVDAEVPKTITLQSSRNFSVASLGSIYDFVPLPKIRDKAFAPAFIKKLDECKEIYDFTGPSNMTEKDTKTKILTEIVNVFENTTEVRALPLDLQNHVFDMLYANIFDQDPKFPTTQQSLDYTIGIIEPSWNHLYYAFQILNRFVLLFPQNKKITLPLMKKAIYLTNLPDSNERMQLLAFIRGVWDSHPSYHPAVLQYVCDQLEEVTQNICPPFCATPLLVFLTHIKNKNPGKRPEGFDSIIRYTVLPLLSSPYFSTFSTQFVQLFEAYLPDPPPKAESKTPPKDSQVSPPDGAKVKRKKKKDNRPQMKKSEVTAEEVLLELDSTWPRTNPAKIPDMINVLVMLLGKLTKAEATTHISGIFKFLASLLSSEFTKVVESVLQHMIGSAGKRWFQDYSRAFVNAFFRPLSEMADESKGAAGPLRSKAQTLLVEMTKVNRVAVATARKEVPKKKKNPQERAMRYWQSVARKAARLDPSIDAEKEQKEIELYFEDTSIPTGCLFFDRHPSE